MPEETMPGAGLLASEVRQRILDDHAALRGLLDELTGLCSRVLHGESDLGPELREKGERFQQRFLAHLDLEDRYLRPALRRADAWGPERAERLDTEHAQQRAFLATILQNLRNPERSAVDVALELRGLAEVIHEDMEHEEQAVLDPDVLRDDVVSVSMEAG